jgi:FMN phosphatase YigB (HAD superfamily)
MFVIFDLDGTLSDGAHRQHLIATEPKLWDAFHRAAAFDTPIRPMVLLTRMFHATNQRVEIWTGRSDIAKLETQEWLMMHGVPYDRLLMRPEGDHRPDTELKGEWLASLNPREWPHLVFEDRTRMVEMWRSRGIQCAQVAPGDF